MVRGHSISSTNLPSNRESNPKPRISSPTSTSAPSPRTPRGKPNGLLPAGYRDDSHDRLGRSSLSIASQCSRLSPTGSIGTSLSRINNKSANAVEQHVSFENVAFDDEEASEENDEEENVQKSRKDTCSVDRSKSSQVQSPRYVRIKMNGVEVELTRIHVL